MILNKIQNTCSMVELGDVSKSSILNLSPLELNLFIYYKINNGNIKKPKVILYNTTMNLIERLRLRKHGFRKIGSYMGNENRRVHIMIKKWE